MKLKITAVFLCFCALLSLCGCVDTISSEKTAKPVSQYYFEDVCQAGGRFYFTTYTDEEREMTRLLCDNPGSPQLELCRFPGTVHVEYVNKSYDSSGGAKMFFYVRPDIGPGKIYSYNIADNSIEIFLREDCSNMIPDPDGSGSAWVIKDSKLICVNMKTHAVIPERSYTAEQLGLSETFPDGFFGKTGESRIEISMSGEVIHLKERRGAKVDETEIKETDIEIGRQKTV